MKSSNKTISFIRRTATTQSHYFYIILYIISCADGIIGLFFILQHESKVFSVHAIKASGERRYNSIHFNLCSKRSCVVRFMTSPFTRGTRH